MSCPTCGDHGIVTLNWSDAPEEYAICLCPAGLTMRRQENRGAQVPALWEVWCAREQVDPSRVCRIEDVLTGDELQARGLVVPAPQHSREAALLNASKRRPKL